MKVKKIFFACICALVLFQSNAQQFEKNSLEHLKVITEVYTHEHDTRTKYRSTEYFILFFEIDSIGKVSDIHMLSDDNNRDSGYAAFKRLTPVAFKDWQTKEYQGKTIVLPVFCNGIDTIRKKSSEYLLKYSPYPPIYIPKDCQASKQKSQYVFCQQLDYNWPSTSTSH